MPSSLPAALKRVASPLSLVAAALSLAACGTVQQQAFQLTDRECMARVMYFESNRSSREGMLAVGTVVMNRVQDPKYPKSVCGVVGQQNQFADGALTKPVHEGRSYALAEKTADAVLEGGERHAGVGNAKFFHTNGYSFPYRNMKYVTLAGGNIFYEKRYPGAGERPWPSAATFARAHATGKATMLASAEDAIPSRSAKARSPIVLASADSELAKIDAALERAAARRAARAEAADAEAAAERMALASAPEPEAEPAERPAPSRAARAPERNRDLRPSAPKIAEAEPVRKGAPMRVALLDVPAGRTLGLNPAAAAKGPTAKAAGRESAAPGKTHPAVAASVAGTSGQAAGKAHGSATRLAAQVLPPVDPRGPVASHKGAKLASAAPAARPPAPVRPTAAPAAPARPGKKVQVAAAEKPKASASAGRTKPIVLAMQVDKKPPQRPSR